MKTALVSEKGQITLPAAMRRELGIKASSRVTVELRNQEIVLRPMRTIADVAGIFHEYAVGKPTDWDEIREETMRIVAEEVACEGL